MNTGWETTTTGDPGAEAPTARRRIGPYELVREAGRGGMSTVYEAADIRDGRMVALKALAPLTHLSLEEQQRHLARLQREAEVISLLRHPNIVNVLDAGMVGDTPETRTHYLVMEYVSGETLAARLSQTGPLSPEETASVLRQIAGALDSVHAAGVVHRDIKPANIMLLPDGTAKLMDFGVARLHDDTMLTRTGTIIGSPAYMSPEQALGQTAGASSDLWSLAAVVYAMLSGNPPFTGDNIPAVLYRVTHESPPPLPGLPAPVVRVLDRAFSRDPQDRFPSADSLAQAFEDALRGVYPEAAPGATVATGIALTPVRPRPGNKTREGWALWLPALLVIGLVFALFAASGLRREQRLATSGRDQVASTRATEPADIATPARDLDGNLPIPEKPSPTARPTPRPVPRVAAHPKPTASPTPVATPSPAARVAVAPTPRPRPSATASPIIVETIPTPAPARRPRQVAKGASPVAPPGPARPKPLEGYVIPDEPATKAPQSSAQTEKGSAGSSLKPPLVSLPPTAEKEPAETPQPTPPTSQTPESPVVVPEKKPEAMPRVEEPAETSREAGAETISDETLSFRGTWQGTHTGHRATLVIKEENSESDTFSGTMTVQTPAGPVTLEVRGRLYDDAGVPEVTLEERRVLNAPAPRSWDLGTNTGRLRGENRMAGSGHDRRGRSYSWQFQR